MTKYNSVASAQYQCSKRATPVRSAAVGNGSGGGARARPQESLKNMEVSPQSQGRVSGGEGRWLPDGCGVGGGCAPA